MLPPLHHHLASLHVAGVGNDGLWLVFNTTSYGSGGRGAGGGRGVRVYQLVLSVFPQVHKCPSQATHVRNLTSPPLLMVINALSVEDFGRVLSRKEPVLLY